MIRPLLSNESFLKDVRAIDPGSRSLYVWWLGQSGFLVAWEGRYLALDPYLSDCLTRKYANTDKPHARMTERVVAPEALGFVSIATSSHNHTDHLDAETLLPLRAANPDLALVIPEANRAFVSERLRTPIEWPRGLTDGALLTLGGFTFHGVPAAHNRLDTDAEGRHLCMGYVVEAGPWRVYHSGDTLLYPGLEERLKPWRVDLALLPINGDRPERRVAGNLDGQQAAGLAHAIGAGLVVPCHYDLFEFNTASPAPFVAACQRLGQPHRVLQAGERMELTR
ncbi:MAG: MBL fold metallo-hydrolase [Verrucomicrobia bacterium]|nr:MBL fold metallo-hydrolase [Verrucomicrobiota bacterium]MBI3869609.1 MBL fold metallo-hydrolase [Verrucomicrobiota bacterium]